MESSTSSTAESWGLVHETSFVPGLTCQGRRIQIHEVTYTSQSQPSLAIPRESSNLFMIGKAIDHIDYITMSGYDW